MADLWNIVDFITNVFYMVWISLRFSAWFIVQVSRSVDLNMARSVFSTDETYIGLPFCRSVKKLRAPVAKLFDEVDEASAQTRRSLLCAF